MYKKNVMNILLCFDDTNWNYTRHAAVTILSVMEKNKEYKIKFYIMTSNLPQKNIDELKRIVDSYNQEIEFIIDKNIIPKELKKVIINKRNLSRGARYRLFFPKYITWIDRILYMDCDVIVMKDISNIYNMDMHWKAIAWYKDIVVFNYKNKAFNLKTYINSWVLLFDLKKYDLSKINVENMVNINQKYSQYFNWCDQDKINLLFNDDILIGKQWMNYQIRNKFSTIWINDAEIIHCLEKPYVQYSSIPLQIKNIYFQYLNLTKWKWYPDQKAKYWYLKHLYITAYKFCYALLIKLFWEDLLRKMNTLKWEINNFYK